MSRGIVSQSEQYGLPTREAGTLPPAAEVSDLLRGVGTTPGYMGHREATSGWDADE